MQIIHLIRLYRRIQNRRYVGFTTVLGLLLFAVLGNALTFIVFDGPDAEAAGSPITVEDAVWYSVISITTIGYGDLSASSTGARIGTVFFIVIVGLGAFSFLLGMTIDGLTDLASRRRRGMSRALMTDHILIVNVPSTTRLTQLLRELKSDPNYGKREIVIVSDALEELPIIEPNVVFIRGSVLEHETYERADVTDAAIAIVLATSYDDVNSDAIVASIVAVIDSMHTDLHIVAECVSPRHKLLFDSVNCDSVVYSMGITANLLVQEAQDPGVAQLIDVITSNVRGTTLFSTEVSETSADVSYNDFARSLLDSDVNLLCVNRGPESLTAWRGVTAEAGDRLIYAAQKRLRWDELRTLASSKSTAQS